jgi:hypothetical protein
LKGPLAALAERFRRRPAAERPAAPEPLSAETARGAGEFQARLDEARDRLRRDIPPPVDE